MKYLPLLMFLCACEGREFHMMCDFITGEEKVVEQMIYDGSGSPAGAENVHFTYIDLPPWMPDLC